MKKLNLFKTLTLVLGCAALAMAVIPAKADGRDEARGSIKAYGGTTFTFAPVAFDNRGNPIRFTHTVDGVARVSVLGNCTFHADIIAIPRPDGSFSLTGTFQITSADGSTVLNGEARGAVMPDPANPIFGNLHYDVRFTGGTGAMANARGSAEIEGLGMFTTEDFSAGKATWTMQGNLTGRALGHRD